jgi:hypothetical protein
MEPTNALRFAVSDRINDAEVGPAHIPLALLGQFQSEVEEFLRGSNKDVDANQATVSIEEGSLALVVTGLLAASGLWTDIERLHDPLALGLVDPKRAAVVERWQAAARKHPHRRYRLADDDGKVQLLVDATSDYRNQVEAVWVSVEKYLQGQVTDLGGTNKANVHLKVAGGNVLTIAASQELLAAEEQNRLYRPAVLRVAAEENLATGALRNLSLLGFEPHAPGWNEDQFNQMVRKGTQAWADVPADWLDNLRGGQG